MRFFQYRFQGMRQFQGFVTGKTYIFFQGVTTAVEDEDGDHFLFGGTHDTTDYDFREVDSSGNPVGPFPPVNLGTVIRAPVKVVTGLTAKESLDLIKLTDPALRKFANKVKLDGKGFGAERTLRKLL